MSSSSSLPKFTVVTPSYNQAEFLEETIDSILSQDYPHLEYIIIDGGSQDGSLEIIKKYDKHLAYWESEKDSGQSEAINKGFKKSTGEILTWICSDDLLLPNALYQATKYFSAYPDVSLIHGKTKLFGEGYDDKITSGHHSDWEIDYFTHMCFPQPASFFRRQIIENYGLLDESLHYAMDYDLLVRIALSEELLPVDALFSAYRLHPDSKSVSQKEKFEIERNIIFTSLLRSLKDEKGLAILKELGINCNEKKVFPTNNTKKKDLPLDTIVSTFLYRKVPLLFETQKYEQVISFVDTIKKHYSEAYQEKKSELESFYKTSQYQSLSLMGKAIWKMSKFKKKLF